MNKGITEWSSFETSQHAWLQNPESKSLVINETQTPAVITEVKNDVRNTLDNTITLDVFWKRFLWNDKLVWNFDFLKAFTYSIVDRMSITKNNIWNAIYKIREFLLYLWVPEDDVWTIVKTLYSEIPKRKWFKTTFYESFTRWLQSSEPENNDIKRLTFDIEYPDIKEANETVLKVTWEFIRPVIEKKPRKNRFSSVIWELNPDQLPQWIHSIRNIRSKRRRSEEDRQKRIDKVFKKAEKNIEKWLSLKASEKSKWELKIAIEQIYKLQEDYKDNEAVQIRAKELLSKLWL